MKVTKQRLIAMQKELTKLESDIWRDLKETEDKGFTVRTQYINVQLKARAALLEAWTALENLIEPWE